MTDPSARRTLFDGIADEFLRDYPRGARLVAVASPDGARSAAAAASLREALAGRGVDARVTIAPGEGAEQLRTEVVAPFRAAGADAVLIVPGSANLLAERARGLWHYSVWVIEGDEVPHTAATALVDVTDPNAPARRLADYCAVPPSFLT